MLGDILQSITGRSDSSSASSSSDRRDGAHYVGRWVPPPTQSRGSGTPFKKVSDHLLLTQGIPPGSTAVLTLFGLLL